MPIYIDMMGYPVEVKKRTMRVVSLVPSLSLTLHDLGIGPRLVGVTKFCVNPKQLKTSSTIIGGTKLLRLDEITRLNPDLIVANKEENNEEDIYLLREQFPVWVSDVSTLADALETIASLGSLVDCQLAAKNLIASITNARNLYQKLDIPHAPSVAYIIWNDPLMVAGGDTFISTMLHEAGFTNAFANQNRYPAVTLQALKELKVDYIFLSSEPYPFKEKHKAIFEPMFHKDQIQLVDGEMFSWYGSQLQKSYTYFTMLREQLKIKQA